MYQVVWVVLKSRTVYRKAVAHGDSWDSSKKISPQNPNPYAGVEQKLRALDLHTPITFFDLRPIRGFNFREWSLAVRTIVQKSHSPGFAAGLAWRRFWSRMSRSTSRIKESSSCPFLASASICARGLMLDPQPVGQRPQVSNSNARWYLFPHLCTGTLYRHSGLGIPWNFQEYVGREFFRSARFPAGRTCPQV
jgi:hypothetical protein